MCNFCNKIYNSIEDFENQEAVFARNCLGLIKDDNKIKLYLSCEDCYYSNFLMEVHFCPVCGKKLENN